MTKELNQNTYIYFLTGVIFYILYLAGDDSEDFLALQKQLIGDVFEQIFSKIASDYSEDQLVAIEQVFNSEQSNFGELFELIKQSTDPQTMEFVTLNQLESVFKNLVLIAGHELQGDQKDSFKRFVSDFYIICFPEN
jgi:hypothetical protein